MHSIEDVLGKLREASRMMQSIRIEDDDKEDAIEALSGVIDLCNDMGRTATKRHIDLRREPRTERQMTNYIVMEMEAVPVKTKASNKEVAAGGEKAAALRKAGGKCELCGAEWRLACHHILPRDEGGLLEPENIMVLCSRCHDEIEPLGFHTRAEIMRYDRTRDNGNNGNGNNGNGNGKTASEKAAETRAANLADDRREEVELSAWASKWDTIFGESVKYKKLTDPEITRPEKPWHVIVYGGGKAAYETLRKQSSGATR